MSAVLDASAVLEFLLGSKHNEVVRRALESGAFAPHLMDIEVVHRLRGFVLGGRLDEEAALQSIHILEGSPIERVPHEGLLIDVWGYRHNLSAYDAAYVALAHRLRLGLITADARLARAPNLPVPVTLIPTA
jgi:predicted nucleic acid-binding protein